MKKVSPKHSACKGFSLAEALMALLVVSLITIATIPVITKKKRSLENIPHGQWTCEIDEDGMLFTLLSMLSAAVVAVAPDTATL